MHFNSVLISCFLFASAVLAGPLQSQQLDLLGRSSHTRTTDCAPQIFGGAFLEQNNGTFNYIHGIFPVPNVTSPAASESFVTVAIAMDGTDSCPGGVYFQVGVSFHARCKGTTEIQAQYEWGPDSAQNLTLPISVGDWIELTLITFNETTGHVFIAIFGSPGLSDDSPVQSSHPLCGKSAGWVVKSIVKHGGQTTIADFETVTFTGASAGKRGQELQGPLGASTVGFHSPKGNVSTTINDNNSLSISYLQKG
ncbi:peptidase G1 [Boletus reticuloceps]|uniref:Peptidase G1 n=1 Tax=Boletus reticuloceps TaxID=495285 RepID=A0A8I2Z1N9_9AGAM|nr:peptidase G1 [Boletus reticuloceps]